MDVLYILMPLTVKNVDLVWLLMMIILNVIVMRVHSPKQIKMETLFALLLILNTVWYMKITIDALNVVLVLLQMLVIHSVDVIIVCWICRLGDKFVEIVLVRVWIIYLLLNVLLVRENLFLMPVKVNVCKKGILL